MSDLTATNCGTGCGCGNGYGNSGCNIIFLLILLSCCGGGNLLSDGGCGCGNGGIFGGDNNCLWLLLLLIKISLYFAGFIKLWQNIKPCKGHYPYWVALTAVMVVFLAAWNQNETAAMAVQQVLLALALLAAPLNRLWNERGRNA